LQNIKINKHFDLSFEEWFSENKMNRHMENIFQYFFYDDLVSLYESKFGQDNVKILCFEFFANDDKGFLDEMLNFMGCSESDISRTIDATRGSHDNKTVTRETIILRNISEKLGAVRKLVPVSVKDYIVKKAKNGKKLTVKMSTENQRFIQRLYAKQNKSLSDRYNLKLEQYGYYCE